MKRSKYLLDKFFSHRSIQVYTTQGHKWRFFNTVDSTHTPLKAAAL